ncbi:MAG: UbiA family prenyltransferase [Nanoarchaeota archaeon]|jgi:4-hydroxybenzoate polyprenyltransferase|nr:UbiA family prenyltransferase [Nanoarchaeota archaeon]
MKGDSELYKIIKSTRILRTIPSILLILLGFIIAKNQEPALIILAICLILIYSAGSIQNAIKDQDFPISKKTKIIAITFVITAIILSLKNYLLLVATLSWILLGFIYNTLSRKILLADTTIMSITHYFIPIFCSLLISGANIIYSLKISGTICLIFWLITPSKNLKETDKDAELKYKTLPTTKKNGATITRVLLWLSLPAMIIPFFILNLHNVYLQIIPISALLYGISIRYFQLKKEKRAMITIRISMILFLIVLILTILK